MKNKAHFLLLGNKKTQNLPEVHRKLTDNSSTIELWSKLLTDSGSPSNFGWIWCILNEIHDMAQKKFLWIIDDFLVFGWKRELYRIFHDNHENRVLFYVSSMIT
jgi:hypothetical protein